MGIKRILMCVLSVGCLLAMAAPPTQAEVPRPHRLLQALVADPAFPAEWSGIWNITTTERVCGSPTIDDMYTEADTLCTGDTFSEDEEVGVTCDGTISSTSIDVTCSGSFSEAGCTITLSSSVNGTRSGDTFTGTGQYSVTFTGTCGPVEDECFDEVYSGSRIAPEPLSCGSVPVLPTSWGLLKAKYDSE